MLKILFDLPLHIIYLHLLSAITEEKLQCYGSKNC